MSARSRQRRRDPQTATVTAEAAELYAQEARDPDAFRVAADAWLEAGDVDRARFNLMYDWVQQAGDELLTTPQYQALLNKLEAQGEANYRFQISEDRVPQMSELDPSVHTTLDELRAFQKFRFLFDPPEAARLYYDDGGVYLSPYPGFGLYPSDIEEAAPIYAGRAHQGRGRGRGEQPSVSVEAINGYRYHGTCQFRTCHVRRGRMWLVPQTGRRLR